MKQRNIFFHFIHFEWNTFKLVKKKLLQRHNELKVLDREEPKTWKGHCSLKQKTHIKEYQFFIHLLSFSSLLLPRGFWGVCVWCLLFFFFFNVPKQDIHFIWKQPGHSSKKKEAWQKKETHFTHFCSREAEEEWFWPFLEPWQFLKLRM